MRAVVAAVTVAAMWLSCIAPARAQTGGPDPSSFLLFSGTDMWRGGAFLYGGLLWSPDELDRDGFTLKTLINGGAYSYNSGALRQDIDGTLFSAAVLPGWRFSRDGLVVSLYAGGVIQDYRLSPADPGARLHGFYGGGQFAADIWYQPNAMTMAAVSGAIASIGPTGYVRTAFGFRLFEPVFIGPETQLLWCGNFDAIQLGLQVTALRVGTLQWSAASGLALTSDGRSGPYLRLGLNIRR